jgi:L-serine kinase (ADP)
LKQTSSPRSFSITNSKIPILLALKRTEELRPHEETVQEDLKGIVKALEQDPVLRHPVIADSATGLVLDGTHRLAALKLLGCLTVPAALIDYQNPLVKVDRWFRTIKLQNPSDLMKRLDKLSPIHVSDFDGEKSLLERLSYATLRDAQKCLAFRSMDSAPMSLCRHAFALEQIARDNHAKIAYADKTETRDLASSTIVMSTIRLEKSEVVDSCIKQELFPPKSTRHLIPSRPLGTNVPLRWLKTSNIEEAETEFEKHLARMRIRKLPEGSVVGSRRYMEEVFLFERN